MIDEKTKMRNTSSALMDLAKQKIDDAVSGDPSSISIEDMRSLSDIISMSIKNIEAIDRIENSKPISKP